MNELQKDLYDVCQGSGLVGIDLGATVESSDIPSLQDAIRDGHNMKGWREPLTVTVTLDDVWKYYSSGTLIEDETGCAHVVVKYGLMTQKLF